MSERVTNILHFLLAAAIAVAFGVWSAYHFRYEPPEPPEPPEVVVQVDTIVIRDTVTAYKPVPFNVYVVDTMWVPVTVHERDTVWAQLPREAKVYQDSSYRAVVSGFRPSLDTISIYQRTVFVDRVERVTIPAPRWSWGVQAGVGATKDGLGPYIGIGLQYRLGK